MPPFSDVSSWEDVSHNFSLSCGSLGIVFDYDPGEDSSGAMLDDAYETQSLSCSLFCCRVFCIECAIRTKPDCEAAYILIARKGDTTILHFSLFILHFFHYPLNPSHFYQPCSCFS